MGQLDLEALLRPVSHVAPCGDNLEYDSEFRELERAAEPTPEHAIGNTVVAAELPDWQAVLRRAAGLFDRTKDLRVAMRLAKALLMTVEPGQSREVTLVPYVGRRRVFCFNGLIDGPLEQA
jgi:type VI secretion system protein ImpA